MGVMDKIKNYYSEKVQYVIYMIRKILLQQQGNSSIGQWDDKTGLNNITFLLPQFVNC